MMPDSLFFSLSSAVQGLHFRLRVCCAGASGHAAVFTSKPQCLFAPLGDVYLISRFVCIAQPSGSEVNRPPSQRCMGERQVCNLLTVIYMLTVIAYLLLSSLLCSQIHESRNRIHI